ncbi:complex I subunit 5 family protein [Saccharopolyspora cebuensis]|uniref:complex I subunit 5 family protein n=1 Tax=Saccharopolyspora cebuensis TaxID=418759 RepID=UPI0031EBCE96
MALLVPWAAGTLLIGLDGRRRSVMWLAVAALTASLAGLLAVAARVLPTTAPPGAGHVVTGGWPAGVGIVLRADALGLSFALLAILVLLVVVATEAAAGSTSRTFPGLVLLLAAGLTGLFLTGDVFTFYVFFELSMTASYALTSFGNRPRQLRAALVFAAVNLFGSFVFLIAVAGTYRVTGALAMSQVADRIGEVDQNAALLIAVGFFVAFSVKLGLFPFHYWLPTVYTSASPGVAAILSGAVANIGAYGLLRLGGEVFTAQARFASTALVLLGIASILYGAVLAIARGDAAEMLAYSAIGQVGYVLVALGIGGPLGFTAAVLYSIVNGLNKTLLFLVTGLRGMLVAAAFAVGAFSVAGVPPAAGFIGKLTMFQAGVAAGSPALVVLLVLGSTLSLIYLFQVYQRDFWCENTTAGAAPATPLAGRLVVGALAAVVLAAGIWPEPLLALSQDAATVLVGGRR